MNRPEANEEAKGPNENKETKPSQERRT